MPSVGGVGGCMSNSKSRCNRMSMVMHTSLSMRLHLSCCRRRVVVTDIQHFSSTSSSVRSVWG